MRRVVAGATLLACAAAAGCGGNGEPRLTRADAAPLIALANRIAVEDGCGQQRDLGAVRARAIALVNEHAVPPELQEPFLAAVNDLASRTPACTPPPPPPENDGDKHDHGKHKGDHKQGGEG